MKKTQKQTEQSTPKPPDYSVYPSNIWKGFTVSLPSLSQDASEHTGPIQTCLALPIQLKRDAETQLQKNSCEATSFLSEMKHGCFIQDLCTPNSTDSEELMFPSGQSQSVCWMLGKACRQYGYLLHILVVNRGTKVQVITPVPFMEPDILSMRKYSDSNFWICVSKFFLRFAYSCTCK